jgi:hypothetical protein
VARNLSDLISPPCEVQDRDGIDLATAAVLMEIVYV